MPDPTEAVRIVVSEFLTSMPLQRLSERHEVVYDPDLYSDRPRLLAEVSRSVGLVVRNRTRVDEELLSSAPGLRVVGRLGVGLDNIDMDRCTEHGVEVFPAIGANTVSVAEYVIGAMMVLARGVFAMTPSMVRGEWPRQGQPFGIEVAGKTLGLVGFGAIARLVAHRAEALDMIVQAHDPYVAPDDPAWSGVQAVSLEELVTTSDVISLHAALTEETRGVIGAEALRKMKPGSILINTSRGETVDERAVAEALREGHLGGAALDVFSTEPIRREGGSVFAGIENLILTPHVAGNTRESVERVADMTVTSVLDFLAHRDRAP